MEACCSGSATARSPWCRRCSGARAVVGPTRVEVQGATRPRSHRSALGPALRHGAIRAGLHEQRADLLPGPSALLRAPSALLPGPSALLRAPSALLPEPSALLRAPSALFRARSALVPGPFGLLPECTALLPGRTALLPKRTALLSERTALLPERTALLPERTALLPERTALLPERTALLPERPGLSRDEAQRLTHGDENGTARVVVPLGRTCTGATSFRVLTVPFS
jgi:hypothetical protein